jgi:hypothetical protein
MTRAERATARPLTAPPPLAVPDGPWRLSLAAGADRAGLVGSSRRRLRWKDVDTSMPAVLSAARRVLHAPWPGLRKLDRLTALLSLVVEALDLPARLPEASRASTAIVFGTVHGCLDSDWRFDEGCRRPPGAQPQLFAYTLPSTCLGDLAIRHGLTGPSLCLSVPRDGERQALAEAARLVAAGDADAALVCLGDWVTPAAAGALGVPTRAAFVATLLEADVPQAGDPLSWSEVMQGHATVATLVETLRRLDTLRHPDEDAPEGARGTGRGLESTS